LDERFGIHGITGSEIVIVLVGTELSHVTVDFPESTNVERLELSSAAWAFENVPVDFGDIDIGFTYWTDLNHFEHS
jgi:hypothetical protein